LQRESLGEKPSVYSKQHLEIQRKDDFAREPSRGIAVAPIITDRMEFQFRRMGEKRVEEEKKDRKYAAPETTSWSA